MIPSRVEAVEPVRIEAPVESADALRDFYIEVALLEEIPIVDGVDAGLRFGSELTELHIRFSPAPIIDSVTNRVTISIPSIEEVVEKLIDRKIDFQRLTGLVYSDRRIQACDPAGNRVDFRRHWPMMVL